jgi:hypothetical protein
MTDHKKYLGNLISGSLMIRESQIIADLLLSPQSKAQWKDAIILQKNSSASAKQNTVMRKTLQHRRDHVQEKQSELRAFAEMTISINLDDGVKVNHGEFINLPCDVKTIHGKKYRASI